MVQNKWIFLEKCLLNKMWDEGYVDKMKLNYKEEKLKKV